jgi:hypothetical protein
MKLFFIKAQVHVQSQKLTFMAWYSGTGWFMMIVLQHFCTYYMAFNANDKKWDKHVKVNIKKI